jgi:hypothetical protein
MDESSYNNAAAVWDELRHADDGCPLYGDDDTDAPEGWCCSGWPDCHCGE